jgi:hypothetical protein
MQQDGFTIREVNYNFTFTPGVNDDFTKGYVIGSRWILDNGDIYVCTDNTEEEAVWELQVPDTGSYWTADGDDIYKNNIGNVGIGTTTPQNKLEVNSGVYDTSGVRLKEMYSLLYQATVLIPTSDTTTLALAGSVAKATNSTGIYWYNTNQIRKTTFAGVTTNYVSTTGTVQSMAFDSLGNLFWTVSGSSILFKSLVGSPSIPVQISDGLMVTPTAIAIDSNNNVFVADFNLNYVIKFANSATGAVTNHGPFHPNLGGPYGSGVIAMCVTPLGDLFIARSNNNTRLTTILANGTSNTVLNGTGCGTLNMLSDSQGFVYTLDFICETVKKISQDGTTILWTILMTNPYGITIENDNKVIVCDRSSPGGIYEVSTGVKILYSLLPTTFPVSISKDGLGNYYTTNMGSPPLTKIWATKENKSIILNGDGDFVPTLAFKVDKNNILTAPFNTFATLSVSPTPNAILTTDYLPTLQVIKGLGTSGQAKYVLGITTSGTTRNTSFYESNIGNNTMDFGRNNWDGYGFKHGAVSNDSSIWGTLAGRAKGSYSTILGGTALQTDSYGEIAMGIYNTIEPGTSNVRVSTDRLLTVGNGDFGAPSDALKILKNGLTTLPSVTNVLIAAEPTGKAIVTREYLESKQIQRLAQYTVATLPTGAQGDTAYVTDALAPAYLVTIVGGGSVVCPVFYNGTNWVAH